MKELLEEKNKMKSRGCRKHGGQQLNYFCKKCEIPICQECRYSGHKETNGHLTLNMEEALQEQRRYLEMEMVQATSIVTQSRCQLNELQAEIGNLFAAKHKVLMDIDKAFDNYIELINFRRQSLKSHATDMYRYRKEGLKNSIDEQHTMTSTLNDMIEQCEDIIANGNIADMMAYKIKMSAKLSDIQQTSKPTTPDNNYLKYDPEENEEVLRDLISDLGSIRAQSPLPSDVRIKPQRSTASLFSTISMTIKSAKRMPIEDYPITVNIEDPFDNELSPLLQHRGGGNYECTFRPQVSGLHRLCVKFLSYPIKGGDLGFEVQSNDPVTKFGGLGNANGEMEYPRDVTVDAHNNIYVVDTGNCRVQIFDKNGNFLFWFPILDGKEDYSSCGIAINHADNTLYCPEVCLQDNDLAQSHSILVYSLKGELKYRLAYGEEMKRALSVAVNSHGHVIIADFELNMIFMFDKHGRLIRKFGGSGSGKGQFNHPTFVCVGKNDQMIVADGYNNRIQIFDNTGKFLYEFGKKGTGPGEFFMPFGVTTDKHGHILIVDGGNKRIQIFQYNGDFVSCIESSGDRMNAPRGIAVTNDGHVLVVDRDNHAVKKYKYLHCTSI